MKFRHSPLPLMAFALLMGGCSQTPLVAFKERLKEKFAPVPPAIRVDRFMYDEPSGPLALVFLIDDTELSAVTGDDFEKVFFRPLLETLYENEKYRALAPGFAASSNPMHGSNLIWDRKLGLDKVFDYLFTGGAAVADGVSLPLFWHRDTGSPLPLAQALAAQGDFQVPTWVIATYATRPARVSIPLPDLIKKKHLGHLRVLQRPASGGASNGSCALLERAEADRAAEAPFQGMDLQTIDPCDPQWAVRARESLLQSIEQEKKRLVLTEKPWEPRTIAVRGAFQRLQFGTDFTFDSTENEIKLLNPGSFQKGDLIEVSYYYGQPQEVLPGNPQPEEP